ncbi:PTS lactose/cellobiose transporter subunit IIA [Paenibacillus sp. BR2-3]|uniref:PTS lactose/cellobiose transporter subunit IIA n=1 Tax=Paenibacillus sp. BR2-3 TaxID=3048494 RepID=UPI003977C6CD
MGTADITSADSSSEELNATEIVFQIILHAGDARSSCMEAIRYAKNGQMPAAREALESAKKELVASHKIQTRLIRKEASGEKMEMTVMMVHAQDHLMNAITIRDMAEEFIDLYEKIGNLILEVRKNE